MKKKVYFAFFLIGALVMASLTACGKGATTTVPASEETISEEKEDATETEELEAETEEYSKRFSISDWGYDNLEYINDKYLFAKEGDKWIIIYAATGERVEWPFKYGEDSYEAEFDSVYMNLQGGCFIGVIAEDDGTYTSALYDPNAEFIRFKLHKNQGYMVDYRDNLIIAETTGKDGTDYYYIISIKDGKYGYTAYKRQKLAFLRSSYGIFNLSFSTFYTDIKTCGWCFNSYDVRDYIDDQTEEKGKLLEYAQSVNNTYEDKAVQVWPNTPNKEGWVRASIFDVDYDKYGSPRFMGESGQAGFYNLLSHEFIKTSDKFASCVYFMTENGSTMCTVSDSRAAITVDLNGEAVSSDEEGAAHRIFDLRTKEWANEDLYKTVKAFGYHKYVRVQNMEGKWGFVDDITMKQTGKWYDLTSDFCNGYAVVINDNKGFIIDENLEIVSKEFEAEGVGAPFDYLEFSDLEGESVFFVKQSDGKVHVLKVN